MDGITTLFDYHSGVVRRVIKAIKYDFMPAVINDILTDTELPDVAFDLITFVPLHRRRQNWRGFNQAEKLAERLHQICLLPVAGTLKRGRFTEPLARSRSFNLRVKSVKRAFQLRSGVSLAGKNLILVDDVFTSGATMFEATRVLKQAGAAKVWGWTLAG
jgi:competence protein ComFC